jgi:hypothetical protein
MRMLWANKPCVYILLALVAASPPPGLWDDGVWLIESSPETSTTHPQQLPKHLSNKNLKALHDCSSQTQGSRIKVIVDSQPGKLWSAIRHGSASIWHMVENHGVLDGLARCNLYRIVGFWMHITWIDCQKTIQMGWLSAGWKWFGQAGSQLAIHDLNLCLPLSRVRI